jgi:hypothetical protein
MATDQTSIPGLMVKQYATVIHGKLEICIKPWHKDAKG